MGIERRFPAARSRRPEEIVGPGSAKGSQPSCRSRANSRTIRIAIPPVERAYFNAKADDGSTPLHWASLQDETEVAAVLLSAGADVNAKADVSATPLHWAARNGHAEVAGVLLSAGADVNAKADDGDTPLHQATEKGHAEVVKLLRAAGAKE